MKHFIDIYKTSIDDLDAIVRDAHAMKAARIGRSKGARDDDLFLADKMIALIFEKPSTRTRASFEIGVHQMGGHTMILSGQEMQLGHGESIADTVRVLSRYVDMIMIRTFEENTLLEMLEYSSVPIINGLTNCSHPCQVMADIMTYQEKRGSIKGKKVAWIGDGNNVCVSFLHAAGQFGFDMAIASPDSLVPKSTFVEYAREKGSVVSLETDPVKAVEGADLIVTDAWLSMHDDETSRLHRHNLLRPYQVNTELMRTAHKDALFMHCLPAHREEEVTSAVMDSEQSVIFDEAENRMHVQKAIMKWCFND